MKSFPMNLHLCKKAKVRLLFHAIATPGPLILEWGKQSALTLVVACGRALHLSSPSLGSIGLAPLLFSEVL